MFYILLIYAFIIIDQYQRLLFILGKNLKVFNDFRVLRIFDKAYLNIKY